MTSALEGVETGHKRLQRALHVASPAGRAFFVGCVPTTLWQSLECSRQPDSVHVGHRRCLLTRIHKGNPQSLSPYRRLFMLTIALLIVPLSWLD